MKGDYEYVVRVTLDTEDVLFDDAQLYSFKTICGVGTFYSAEHSEELIYEIDGE